MVVAMSRDIRVLVIKLADRLHNMRTMRYLPEHKRHQKSRETLEIFAPLAHRLGMNTIKWELEDLAFAMLYPKRYDEIARMVSERAPRRDLFLQEVIEKVSGDLREAKIRAVVKGRPKHYYSVYQKMIARDVAFDDIYDLVGIRVLVDTVRDCYAALGTIHARWNPVPGRFKDYIAMPKFNMYQSLHTTVIGPEGKPVELQIRTHAHAPPGRVRRGRALEVQGGRRRPPGPPRGKAEAGQRHGLAAPAPGLAEGDRRPGRVPGVAPVRPVGLGGLRLHPAGPGHRPARGGARRSTSPTPCTPRSATAASAPGSTAGWCRWSRGSATATPWRSSPPSRPTPARRATGSSSSSPAAPATRSASGSPRSAARPRSRRARRPSAGPCASRACRCSA